MTGTWRLWAGQTPIAALDPGDRGLAYGDGVFETILVDRGRLVWWDRHLARLLVGCDRLGIARPDADFLLRCARAQAADCGRGVLKLILTRGSGARGYARPLEGGGLLALGLADPPPPAPAEGLRLRWCDLRLARQPRLAGIKHLNRLEQVLARAEWSDPAIHEGLVCDLAGDVVGATAANLFVLHDGAWVTPPVDDSGIAGVCRGWILEHVQGAQVARLKRAQVESAQAIVLCNAVRGILGVCGLGTRRWALLPEVRALIAALAAAEPAFDAARMS